MGALDLVAATGEREAVRRGRKIAVPRPVGQLAAHRRQAVAVGQQVVEAVEECEAFTRTGHLGASSTRSRRRVRATSSADSRPQSDRYAAASAASAEVETGRMSMS